MLYAGVTLHAACVDVLALVSVLYHNAVQLLTAHTDANVIDVTLSVIYSIKSAFFPLNSLPSSLYCIIISIILCLQKSNFNYDIKKDKNDDIYQASHIISYLKIMLIIYTFYIFKGIFHYFLAMKIEFNNNIYQIFISIIYFLIDLFYYIFTVVVIIVIKDFH